MKKVVSSVAHHKPRELFLVKNALLALLFKVRVNDASLPASAKFLCVPILLCHSNALLNLINVK